MRRVVALAMAVGLVALAVPGARGATPPRKFGKPKVLDTDAAHSSGEPSIRVAADGAIYITGPTGFGGLRYPVTLPVAGGGNGGDLLWRSSDGGKTWTYLGTYDNSLGGGDADITSSTDGTLFASGLYVACVSVARSGDRGQSWTPGPNAGCSTSVLDDRQWNDTYGEKVYTAFGGGATSSDIWVTPSLATSPAVVPGAAINVSQGSPYQWPGVLTVDQRDGTVYTAWNTAGAPNDCDDGVNKCAPRDASKDRPDEIRVSVLADGASSAPTPRLVASRRYDTFDAFAVVDVDRKGRIYVVWNERHPEVRETWAMLATSKDRGLHWTAPVRVNTVPTVAFPWVTAGDSGRIAISYYGTKAKGNSPETVAGDWRVYTAYSTDAGKTFTEYTETPHYVHQGAVCTSGTGCMPGTRDLLDFFETDMDAAGCLVTAYTDNSRDVVDKTGTRTTNAPELLAFVRQSSGPGLLSGRTCKAP